MCLTQQAMVWHVCVLWKTVLRCLTLLRCMPVLCALLSLPTLPSTALADTSPGDISSGVRKAVLGIISFTRWPVKPVTLRLCVVGQASFADALFDAPMQVGPTPVVVSRGTLRAGHAGEQCDAVYSGSLSAPDRVALRVQLAGHPVLTIAEDDRQCSDSSMFCLDTTAAGGEVLFAVNLDSVARSGVEVNPRVLLLGRRKRSQR